MSASCVKERKAKKDEHFVLERGYVVLDDGDLCRPHNLELLGKVLSNLGVEVVNINAGFSDLVLKFNKKAE